MSLSTLPESSPITPVNGDAVKTRKPSQTRRGGKGEEKPVSGESSGKGWSGEEAALKTLREMNMELSAEKGKELKRKLTAALETEEWDAVEECLNLLGLWGKINTDNVHLALFR